MANYQVSGSKILGPDGQPFVARGINIGGYLANNLPPASTDQITRMVDVCVQWGINTVRLVQNGGRRYSWSVANQGYKGKTGPEAAAVAMSEYIDAFRARGIVCIPECHDFTTNLSTSQAGVTQALIDQYWAETVDFWTRIATKYKTDSGVWYNLYNEPYVVGQEWHDRHETAVQAIRAQSPAGIIVLDAPRWGQDLSITTAGTGDTRAAWEPTMAPDLSARYGGIVLAHHSYGALITSTATAEAYIDRVQGAGLPILFGEVGWHRVRGAWNAALYDLAKASSNAVFDVAIKRGVGALWWASAFNDEFSLWYDPDTGTQAEIWDANTTPLPWTEGGAAFKAWLEEFQYRDGRVPAKSTAYTRAGAPVAHPLAPLAIFRAATIVKPSARVTWLACGDSAVAGEGLSDASKAWPHRLSALLQGRYPSTTGSEAPVINASGALGAAGQLQVVQLGRAGKGAYDYLTDSDMTFVATAKPQVVSHMVGAVEYAGQWTPQLLKSRMRGWFAKIDAAAGAVPPVHVVICQPARGDVTAATFSWAAYRRAMMDLCESYPRAVFLDLDAEGRAVGLGGRVSSDPFSLRAANLADYTTDGHAWLAELIFSMAHGTHPAFCAPPVEPPAPPLLTPTSPTFRDRLGTASDQLVIPSQVGVKYQLAGVDITAGTYDNTKASGTVTVTAIARPGYTLTPAAPAAWTWTYSTDNTLPPEPTSGTITSDSMLVTTADAGVTGAQTDNYNGGVPRIWLTDIASGGRVVSRQNKGYELFNSSHLYVATSSPDMKVSFTQSGVSTEDGKVVLRGPVNSTSGAQIRAAVRVATGKMQAAQVTAANGSEVSLGSGVAMSAGDSLSATLKGNQLTVRNETTGESETVTVTANAAPSHVGFRVGGYAQLTVKNVTIAIPA